MRCVILQPSFLPWRGYFHQIARADVFVFYDDVAFDKGGWRNRNRFVVAGAARWLTVPVHLDGPTSATCPITAVRIDNHRDWRTKHLRSLRESYRRAPAFGTVWPLVESIYAGAGDSLVQLNIDSTIQIARWLGLEQVRFVRSSELGITGGQTERLVSIATSLGATDYLCGPAARHYLDESQLRTAGLELEYMTYDYPAYPQLLEPFDPALSIIDLIMMTGDRAPDYFGRPSGATGRWP